MVRAVVVVSMLALTPAALHAQVDPASGIDFAAIGLPGNAAWQGDGTPDDRAIGRGSVSYEYRIGRFEVTTSQWVEFFNAAFDRPSNDLLPHLIPPTTWGAVGTTPTTPGARRWSVPSGNEMIPVGNISWRMAAMYCNWLHNDKSASRGAFLNGAYDVSTFGYVGSTFTDQFTHSPGARYWIPTWDEWLKATHFDPNRFGPGQAGWWSSSNRTNGALTYGPPGVLVNGRPTEANAGWSNIEFPGFNPFAVALGSYVNVQSPWGLFDVAGGTAEWTEEVLFTNGVFPTGRRFDGSHWLGAASTNLSDWMWSTGGSFPSLSTGDLGFRIAMAVPSPSACVIFGGAFSLLLRQRH